MFNVQNKLPVLNTLKADFLQTTLSNMIYWMEIVISKFRLHNFFRKGPIDDKIALVQAISWWKTSVS